jgi:hypothetical protein
MQDQVTGRGAGRPGPARWLGLGVGWIDGRRGQKQGQTLKLYHRYFLRWLRYFDEKEIPQPGALRRENVTEQ